MKVSTYLLEEVTRFAAVFMYRSAWRTVCRQRQASPVLRLRKPRRVVAPKPDVAAIKKEVEQVEYAFAATMAQRKPQAFASFIADDAVFLTDKSLGR